MTRSGVILFIVVSFLVSPVLNACGPSIPRARAEQEVGDATLDYLVTGQVGASASYRRMPAQPWSNAPYEAGIVVLAPAKPDQQGIDYLDTEKPLKVWWLADAALTPVTGDTRAAVEDYRNTHMLHRQPDAHWGWSYTEFGILSMTNGNQEAKVYVGSSCGPLCGTGTIYTFKRDASGNWTITDSQMVWIS